MSSTTHHTAVGQTVEIIRDSAGIPHIYAASSTDLHFGLGFAMAEDRLWQMDRLRRRALGRQAEIMGPSYLAMDIHHHTVGLPDIAAREATQIDPETGKLVDAFIAGINAGITAFGDSLPPEFGLLGYRPEPFTRTCVIAIGRGLWWSLNGRIDRLSAAEAASFLPEGRLREMYLTPEASEHLILPDPAFTPPLASGTDDATGSNNWAIRPDRTGGQAILAGDPHQPFWVPGTWYEFALHGPEDNAAGCGHPGVPGLWWGSNGNAAWCLTNNAASTRDLYRETVDPADPTRYRDGNAWRHFTTRTAIIAVKGAASHHLTVRETVRGPIVNALVPPLAEGGEPPLSLRWVGAEHIDDMRALIGLARATTWEQFRTTLRDWSVAVFNWIYADIHGNVGYQMAGRIPLRPRFHPGYRDAMNGDDGWAGFIPFDALPYSYNPPRGYVASANQRVTPPDQAPILYGAYSQGHRGIRIDEMFATGALTSPVNIAAQNDVKSIRAERMVPHILAHLPDDDTLAAAFATWDYRYTLDSTAATMFETFMALWQRAVSAVHVPARLHDLTQQQTGLGCALLEEPDLAYFPNGTPEMIGTIAEKAAATLAERLGPDLAGWTWGRVHIAHWKHPLTALGLGENLDIGPAPVDGGSHTVRNTGGEQPPHGAFSGAEYRIVVDFAHPDRFLAMQNIGNSGVPTSPHYRDQFHPWIDGTYHTVHLSRAGVEADRRSTTLLTPGAGG